MKLQEQEVLTVEGDSFKKHESTINSVKFKKLYGLLSNLYKNAPQAIVREYVSNADDARIAANNDSEIIVTVKNEENNSFFTVQDFGLGMSPDTMNNIYFNFLDSTKEHTNSLLGYFGLGSKSALAYTDAFYIDTIYEGTLYHYLFSKQSNGIPAGELLYTEPTKNCNGTTIIIPIKDSDVCVFTYTVSTQLRYFPNIKLCGVTTYINNKIYSVKKDNKILFKHVTNNNFSHMHIVLGHVVYQIDWDQLGMSPVPIDIGLYFDIGELTPTPSRENIVYSKDSIKLIKNRIKEVAEVLIAPIQEEAEKATTIKQCVAFYNKYINYYFYYKIDDDDNVGIYISKYIINMINKNINFPTISLKPFEGLIPTQTIIDHIWLDYCSLKKSISKNGYYNTTIKNPGFTGYADSFTQMNDPELKSSLYTYFYKENSFNKTKNKYITDKYPNTTKVFLTPAPKNLSKYIHALGLKTIDKSKWRSIIINFQKLAKEFVESTTINYDKINIDEDWLKEHKKQKYKCKVNPTNNTIPILRLNFEDSWEKHYYSIKKLCDRNPFMVYDTTEYKKDMKEFAKFLNYETPLKFIVISKVHHKLLQGNPNIIKWTDFIKSDHKYIRNIITAVYYDNKVNKLRSSSLKLLKRINTNIYNKVTYMTKFKETYLGYTNSALSNKTFIKMYDNIKAHNLFNPIAKGFCDEIHDYFSGIETLNLLFNSYYEINNTCKYTVMILKYLKKPVNKVWYLKEEYIQRYLDTLKYSD